MARGKTTQNLYLQVDASVDGVQRAAKVMKVSLAEMGASSAEVQRVVAENFRKMSGSDVVQSARQLEASYKKTFANIRAAAMDTLGKPMTAATVVSGNVASAEQQLTSARATAEAYRTLADAQARLVGSSAEVSAADRQMLVLLETEALGMKESVVAAEQRVAVLRRLQTALGGANVEEEAAVGAHTRMGASTMIAEHVVRSFSDSIAAGQSPVRALTMEIGRISEAMTFWAMESNATTGVVGKLASFMGGSWGLAISVGIAALSPFVSELFETKDASNEALKATQEFANYQSDLGHFIDQANGKLIERNRLLAETALIQRRTDTYTQAGTLTFSINSAMQAMQAKVQEGGVTRAGPRDAALSRILYDFRGSRDITAANAALQELAKNRPDLLGLANTFNSFAGAADLARSNIQRLRGEQTQLTTALAGGTVPGKEMAERQVAIATATTALEKAQIHLNDVRHQGDLMKDGNYDAAAWKKYEADLLAATQAVKKLQNAQKEARASGAASNQATDLAYMESFLKRELPGVRITSTTGGQHVANSDHYKARAIDFVPAGGMGSMTKDDIRQLFESNGLRIRRNAQGVEQLFGPGDPGHDNHFHVAWEGRAPTSATLDRRQQAMVTKDANTDRAFQSQLASAQQEYLRAVIGSAGTAKERYDLEVASAKDRLTSRLAEIDDMKSAGKIPGQTEKEVEANAEQLRELARKTEKQQEINATLDRLHSELEQQVAIEQRQAADRADLLRLHAAASGTTRAQRRSDLLNALAADESGARAEPSRIISTAAANPGAYSDKQVMDAKAALAKIDADHPYKVDDILKQTQSPLDAYRQQLKSAAGDMNEALQGVAVDGLKNIEDGLVGLISGTESASQAFKQMASSIIADLAKIAIEKAFVSVLGFGLKDGGKIGGFADGGLPGFAIGGNPTVDAGIIRGRGTGRSDSILAMVGGRRAIRVSNGEGIVNERAVRRWWPVIDSMNRDTFRGFADGGLLGDLKIPTSMPTLSHTEARALGRASNGSGQSITFDLRGAVMTDDLLRQMNDISARHAMGAVIGGSQMAQREIAEHQHQAIP